MTTAIYPGTFDPMTKGHLDLIKRASSLFDTLIIGVAVGHHKKTRFSLEERLAFVDSVIAPIPNVQVFPLSGLLVDFAKAHEASVILRGLRTAADFEYEFQLAGMNRNLNPDIETVFMTPSQETLFISSTLVRELILLKGELSQFIPAPVLALIHKAAHVA